MALLSRTMPQSPSAPDILTNTVTSTPNSQLHSNAPPTILTPLLNEHSNGTTSSTVSPLAIAAAALVNSHNPVSVAAAISTLQQLQQQQQVTITPSSPSSSTSPHSFRSGTVTARPLNFTSPVRSNQSPLITKGLTPQPQSPKVVTIQPLPNSTMTTRMAEVIASLQSSILMQQQQLGASQGENIAPSPSTELPSNKTQQEPHPPLSTQTSGGVDQTAASFLTPSNPPDST